MESVVLEAVVSSKKEVNIMSKVKSYEVMIPVFKKGDDLRHCMKHTNTDYEAFKLQASYYEMAAAVCKRMASFIYENPGVRIDSADTHMIMVEGTAEQCAPLLSDEVLYDFNLDSEEEDEEAYTPSFEASYASFEEVCLTPSLEEAYEAYTPPLKEAYKSYTSYFEDAYANFKPSLEAYRSYYASSWDETFFPFRNTGGCSNPLEEHLTRINNLKS